LEDRFRSLRSVRRTAMQAVHNKVCATGGRPLRRALVLLVIDGAS
jgi:hypothetical protein